MNVTIEPIANSCIFRYRGSDKHLSYVEMSRDPMRNNMTVNIRQLFPVTFIGSLVPSSMSNLTASDETSFFQLYYVHKINIQQAQQISIVRMTLSMGICVCSDAFS